MPHISSKKLKKEHLQKLYNEFSSALEKSAKKSWIRFAVIYLLSKNIPITYIAETLCMSPTTIFRMSFRYDIGKYSSLLKIIETQNKDIWTILEKILKAGLPPRTGRGRWKFLYN